MDISREWEAPPPPWYVQGGRAVQRVAARLRWVAGELFGSRSFLLALGGFAMVLTGAMLNSATAAFFTSTRTIDPNSFTTATVSLGAPTFTAFGITNAVPGDMFSRTIVVQNTSTIAVPYYLTTFATGSSALDTSTAEGLRLVLLRCGTEAAPVDCATATSFESVRGVMDTASAVTVTTSGGVPTSPALSVNGNDMTFTSGQGNVTGTTRTYAAVPVLTRNNPNTQGRCSTTNDGGCLLGGATAAVGNPAMTVASAPATISVPALPTASGLAAGATDRFVAYVVVPGGATSAVQALTSTLTFAFTAVQPQGALNPAR